MALVTIKKWVNTWNSRVDLPAVVSRRQSNLGSTTDSTTAVLALGDDEIAENKNLAFYGVDLPGRNVVIVVLHQYDAGKRYGAADGWSAILQCIYGGG